MRSDSYVIFYVAGRTKNLKVPNAIVFSVSILVVDFKDFFMLIIAALLTLRAIVLQSQPTVYFRATVPVISSVAASVPTFVHAKLLQPHPDRLFIYATNRNGYLPRAESTLPKSHRLFCVPSLGSVLATLSGTIETSTLTEYMAPEFRKPASTGSTYYLNRCCLGHQGAKALSAASPLIPIVGFIGTLAGFAFSYL